MSDQPATPEVPDTISMPAADARKLLLLSKGSSVDGWTVMTNEPTGDEFRWAHGYWLVIRNEAGHCYAADYRIGDGDQGERPWEYDERVQFVRMVPREKTVTEYIRPAAADR